MVHFYTCISSIPDGIELHENIEATFFNKTIKPNVIHFDNEISLKLLTIIDGITNRNGNAVTNKFGTTTIKDISTGCKGALLLVNFPSICIINTELGDNALTALLELGQEFEIHIYVEEELKQRVLKAGRSIRVTVDGKECSLLDAYKTIYDIFDSNN